MQKTQKNASGKKNSLFLGLGHWFFGIYDMELNIMTIKMSKHI